MKVMSSMRAKAEVRCPANQEESQKTLRLMTEKQVEKLKTKVVRNRQLYLHYLINKG